MTDEMIDMQTTLVFDSWLEAGPELRADSLGDRHLIYEGGGIILDLLLKAAENGGRLHVGGQVLPTEQSLNTVADLAVSIEHGKDRSFTHTNALGEFTFHTLPNVKMDLTITLKNRKFSVRGLSNKEPRMWRVVPTMAMGD